jgi:hypothetical protein
MPIQNTSIAEVVDNNNNNNNNLGSKKVSLVFIAIPE